MPALIYLFLSVFAVVVDEFPAMMTIRSKHLPVLINNRNNRKRCEICPKFAIKASVLVSSLFICTYFSPLSSVPVVNFEQVNDCWV